MAKVKTVSVQYERKLNLERHKTGFPYESATVGCTLWADIEENEDLDKAMRSLWRMAKTNVQAASAIERGVPDEGPKHQKLGLPDS